MNFKYQAVGHALAPHGITLRDLSRNRNKSSNWASNIATGRQSWNLAIESALYELSGGDLELVAEIERLSNEAFAERNSAVTS